jgi:hypothetical protein
VTGYFEDHGLPLVQLKEQRRRDLVVALMGRCSGPINAPKNTGYRRQAYRNFTLSSVGT